MASYYTYTARTKDGRRESGVIEASTSDEAVTLLQNKELLVLGLQERSDKTAEGAPAAAKTSAGPLIRKHFHKSVKASDLIIFSRSLAAMTDAGLPLLRAMETVQSQIRSKGLSDTLGEMLQDIRGGSTFRDAIAKHPKIFTPFWISMVETGEASGQLTKSLEQIAAQLEKSGAVQRKVISALIYPAILLLVAIVAIFIFTLKIIPTFGNMYKSFGADLPMLTQMVLNFSGFMQHYILLVLLIIGGAVFFFSSYIRTKPGRWQFDLFRLKAPIFGPVFQGVAAEQFASNLGTLLKAGVPILHALEIVITTCDNKVIAALFENMRAGVREGKPLADPLLETDLLPAMVGQMLAVGEQTGKLPDMLGEISKYYEEQVTTAVDRMTTLLEPIMLVGMGLIIGVLVMSMYLPIFNMTSIV